jgi:hypothetical protein
MSLECAQFFLVDRHMEEAPELPRGHRLAGSVVRLAQPAFSLRASSRVSSLAAAPRPGAPSAYSARATNPRKTP